MRSGEGRGGEGREGERRGLQFFGFGRMIPTLQVLTSCVKSLVMCVAGDDV